MSREIMRTTVLPTRALWGRCFIGGGGFCVSFMCAKTGAAILHPPPVLLPLAEAVCLHCATYIEAWRRASRVRDAVRRARRGPGFVKAACGPQLVGCTV